MCIGDGREMCGRDKKKTHHFFVYYYYIHFNIVVFMTTTMHSFHFIILKQYACERMQMQTQQYNKLYLLLSVRFPTPLRIPSAPTPCWQYFQISPYVLSN